MKKNKNKIIPLDQFIDKALYDKKCGYYMKSNPFGKNGDFVTAPSISILFSEMILVWIISFWENLNKPNKFTTPAFNYDEVEIPPKNSILLASDNINKFQGLHFSLSLIHI